MYNHQFESPKVSFAIDSPPYLPPYQRPVLPGPRDDGSVLLHPPGQPWEHVGHGTGGDELQAGHAKGGQGHGKLRKERENITSKIFFRDTCNPL